MKVTLLEGSQNQDESQSPERREDTQRSLANSEDISSASTGASPGEDGGAAILAKWSQAVPSLPPSWSMLLSSYPSCRNHAEKPMAADEALFKASLLHLKLPLREFGRGIRSWVAHWIDASQRPVAVQTPQHLRGKIAFQEFWAMGRNIQAYQNTHVVTTALLRLAKVRLAEKYDEMKSKMRMSTVRRKRGQTAAAKAKEIIFETTFLDLEETRSGKAQIH